jgi:hypothetical protein
MEEDEMRKIKSLRVIFLTPVGSGNQIIWERMK